MSITWGAGALAAAGAAGLWVVISLECFKSVSSILPTGLKLYNKRFLARGGRCPLCPVGLSMSVTINSISFAAFVQTNI
jgi:hypothetical protein